MRFNDYAKALLRGDIEAAEKVRRLDIPSALLKYVWLDGSEDDENKFATLERSEIWLSKAVKFNDPCDLKRMTLDYDRLRDFGYTESDFPRLEAMVGFSDYGVSCLTDNSLADAYMWEKYANDAKGFCIEYEVLSKGYIWEVLYEDEPIDASWLAMKLDDALSNEQMRETAAAEARYYASFLVQALWIKTLDWKREREFRVVRDIGDKIGENLPTEELGLRAKRIVAGANCQAEDVARLSDISYNLGLGNVHTFMSTANTPFDDVPGQGV